MSKKNRWKEMAKPAWWPEEVPFRSPNERKAGTSMSVHEIDMTLQSCYQFLRVLIGTGGDGEGTAKEDVFPRTSQFFPIYLYGVEIK